MIEINIAQEFTIAPGARNRTEGLFSGEDFRETILEPKFLLAVKNNEKLAVNLDGGYGYATSFLEESFGGLARIHGVQPVLDILVIISEDDQSLIENIQDYIIDCQTTKYRKG